MERQRRPKRRANTKEASVVFGTEGDLIALAVETGRLPGDRPSRFGSGKVRGVRHRQAQKEYQAEDEEDPSQASTHIELDFRFPGRVLNWPEGEVRADERRKDGGPQAYAMVMSRVHPYSLQQQG
jgi:hypothetical protein